MMPRYGFAVIGNGYMARRHITCLENHPRCDIRLVINSKEVVVHGPGGSAIPAASSRELLSVVRDDPAIHAVIVCSPDATHVAYVSELLRSDKVILCEKPLARTEQEFRTLLDLASGREHAVVVGMNCRFRSRIQHLKQLIDRGAISGVNLMTATYYSNIVPVIEGKVKSWWLDYPSGVVPFLHGGAIHLFDALRFLAGETAEALCVPASRSLSRGIGGDSFVVILKFASGAIANVVISGTSHAPNRFQISIDAEVCSIDDHNEYVRDPETSAVETRALPEDDFKDLERQLSHVVDVLDGQAKPLNSIREAYRNYQLIKACEQSATTRTWVTVPPLASQRPDTTSTDIQNG